MNALSFRSDFISSLMSNIFLDIVPYCVSHAFVLPKDCFFINMPSVPHTLVCEALSGFLLW